VRGQLVLAFLADDHPVNVVADDARPGQPSDHAGRPLIAIAGLAVLALVIRIPFLAVPMINDEGGYAYVAHFWAAGQRLYADLPFDRPQGIFVIYRAIFALLGDDVVAIRMAAALVAAATLIAIVHTARVVISPRAGWIAGALFAVLGASPSIEGFTANAELFANLPLVVAAYFTWRERWVAAGLLAGIAFVIKPSAISAFALLIAWCLLQRGGARALLRGSAAFALAPAASVLHGAAVDFQAYFASLVSDRLLAFSLIATSASSQWSRFVDSLVVTSPAWTIPLVLAAAGIAALPGGLGGRAARFGAIWLLASLAGMSIGGTWYYHYYMQLLPPLVIFAGAAHFGSGWRRASIVALLALALLRFAVLDGSLWFAPSDQISLRVYGRAGYLFSQQIAELISARTKPTDTLYVAFSEAQLYYLTRRRAAVPGQLYWNQAERNERAFDAALRAIEQRQPAMIVWAQPPPHWISAKAFHELLNRGYRLVRVFGPIGVFERKP
jgi:hypothetical protein